MTRAQVLRAKVVKMLEDRGVSFVVDEVNSDRLNYTAITSDEKKIVVQDVYRHNGTSENCSVEIKVCRVIDGWKNEEIYNSGKITEKSGYRAINNRIDKALEKFLYNGTKPFDMSMLDLYYE